MEKEAPEELAGQFADIEAAIKAMQTEENPAEAAEQKPPKASGVRPSPTSSPPPPLSSKAEPSTFLKPLLPSAGLGRIGFNLTRYNFMGVNAGDMKGVLEHYATVGSVVNLSLQWAESDFMDAATMLTGLARQAGLTTMVTLNILKDTEKGELVLQVPRALQGSIQGKPSFSQKVLADKYIETLCQIARKKPHYLCVANDLNMLSINRQSEYQQFLVAYKIAYREIKKISPATKVFPAFQYELFKQVKAESTKIMHELRPELDALAISSHPRDVFTTVPEDHYKELTNFTKDNLPLVVIEIGWPSPNSEADNEQRQFLKSLPSFFEGLGPSLLCWDSLSDPTEEGKPHGPRHPNNGLLAADGSRKKAYFEWERLQKMSPQSEHKGHRRTVSDQVPLPPPITADRSVSDSDTGSSSKSKDEQALISPSGSSQAPLNINFFSDSPRIFEYETRPFAQRHVLENISHSPHYPRIQETGWADLLTARIAHLVGEAVYQEASKSAQVLNFNQKATNLFDLAKVQGFLPNIIEEQIATVLDDAAWLAQKKEQYGKSTRFHSDVVEDQGPRPTMEDRHVVVPYLNELCGADTPFRIDMFGVFDGHGGSDTAEYVATHLPFNLMDVYQKNQGADFRECLTKAFLETDENYIKYAERKSISPNMGSTAVVGVLLGPTLYIAWAGDSEACLIGRDGSVFPFVTCHKPKMESERDRIERDGGFVSEMNGLFRVNGVLAVSRAFGDIMLKAVVPAEPEIASYTFKGNELFLLLACDGLWDVMREYDVEEFADNYFSAHKTFEGVSLALAQEARRRRSTDNITSVFVSF